MAKDLRITFLLDFYGDMLTEKQREVVECYYNEDLSLAEIAEEKGITRQGVRDGIMRAEHTLRATEEKLGLVSKYGQTQANLEKLADIVWDLRSMNNTRYHDPKIAELCDQALQIARQLSE